MLSTDEVYVWPPSWLSSHVHHWLPPNWLDLAARVVALINGKGGVGKTSIASNLGGLGASGGRRTLVVDVNAQGNVSRELGIRNTKIDDQGEAFYEAMRRGTPLQPVRDVRPNLDVVVGGKRLEGLGGLIRDRILEGAGEGAFLSLARCLVPIASDYDLIFIDSPPENAPVERLILTTSRYLLVPTKSDGASIDGLSMVADRYKDALSLNPDLEILGVILFATGRDSVAIHRRAQQRVQRILGIALEEPLFGNVIGHAEKTAVEAREAGKLIFELEEHRLDRMRDPDKDDRQKTPVENLSEDYDRIFEQFIQRLADAEAAEVEEEMGA